MYHQAAQFVNLYAQTVAHAPSGKPLNLPP